MTTHTNLFSGRPRPWWYLLALLWLALPAQTFAQSAAKPTDRGRIRISGNTLVTDYDTRLRSAGGWFEGVSHSSNGDGKNSNPWLFDESWWKSMWDNGSNFVRLNSIDPFWKRRNGDHFDFTNQTDVNEYLVKMDLVVDLASKYHMYVMISYHDVGGYDLTYLRQFWTVVAAHYRNRTHVFFELANEPVQWYPENYSDQLLADQKEVYDLIRLHAPDTHIVMLSFATTCQPWHPATMKTVADRLTARGVSWSNASVGFHPYGNCGKGDNIRELKNAYPCINTEQGTPTDGAYGEATAESIDGNYWGTQTMEQYGISWATWNQDGPEQLQRNYVNGVLADARAKGYLWTFDRTLYGHDTPLPPAPPAASSGTNLALNKSATQVSTTDGGTANKAVDGNTDGTFNNGSVTHTGNPSMPWWQVDLGSVSAISQIEVYNRIEDCCRDRTKQFYVLVSDSPFSSEVLNTTLRQSGVSAYYVNGSAGRPGVVAVNRSGRYVRIQLTSNEYLSLAEVKVIGGTPLRQPENPASTLAGLDYSYYHGTWNNLPNFEALKPVKAGAVTGVTIAPRTQTDNFGFKYSGFISVPTDGTYTFYTSSDDGSRLYIGNQEVVNNDGLHGMTERSGAIGLKAGKHAFTVTYFEQGGAGEGISVSYAGPGIAKGAVPNGALYRVGAPATASYSGTYKITARHSGKALEVAGSGTADGANVQQWGYGGASTQQWIVTATGDGYYKLINKNSGKALDVSGNSTADGSNVHQWSYGGLNSQQWQIEATSGGFCRIINKNSGKALDVSGNSTADGANVHQWGYGGGNNQQWRLEQVSTATARSAFAGAGAEPEVAGLNVYPNPARTRVTVDFVAEAPGNASVTVLDALSRGQLRTEKAVTSGANSLTLSVTPLKKGLYFVVLQVDGKRVTRKLLVE